MKRPKTLYYMSEKVLKVHSKNQDKYIDYLLEKLEEYKRGYLNKLNKIEKLIREI